MAMMIELTMLISLINCVDANTTMGIGFASVEMGILPQIK